VKVKTGGGTAGHNGLRSIDAHIGNGFRRVRIGIGHPGHKDRVHGDMCSAIMPRRRWMPSQRSPTCSARSRTPIVAQRRARPASRLRLVNHRRPSGT
jgi:hypothetical protein